MKLKILVVIKLGALGDIVRTSYIVDAYAKSNNFDIVYWITKENAIDLLKNNKNIRLILNDSQFSISADEVLSLDDEIESVKLTKNILFNRITGSYLNEFGKICYTSNSGLWFDMGLISRFGKSRADILKIQNKMSHTEIFSKILNLSEVKPFFYGDPKYEQKWLDKRKYYDYVIGFNIFAGSRWPSKELIERELIDLVRKIKKYIENSYSKPKIIIFTDDSNYSRAINIKSILPYVEIWNTERSILDFAASIKACNYIISTDSLGLHLAISQSKPNLSYYAPTSAAEIDTFGIGVKVISTSSDYCSYKANVDTTSLTANRIFVEWVNHISQLKNYVK